MAKYQDRRHAGRQLATLLGEYVDQPEVLVLGLPRGGIPVAYEVALALQAPLDVFLVRKLGVPGHEELAMGAVATGGVRVLSSDVIAAFGLNEAKIAAVTALELEELERRERAFRDDRPAPDFEDRTCILIDDGLATGSTMYAAVLALRQQEPQRIVIAVPVAAGSTCLDLGREVDDIICAATPEPFYAVGLWYEDFAQTTDEKVRQLLTRAAEELPAVPHK